MSAAAPVPLAPNTPRRFYAGGRGILDWRGLPIPDDFDDHRPEDWLASTTRLFAEGRDGLTALPEGGSLADTIQADPMDWLGPEHVSRYGDTPDLLVKLLDADERTPVHAHPDRTFAERHLGCRHGKTEAWLVLDAEPDARVWLGWHSPISPEHMSDLVDAQDERLLQALHEIPVRRGDSILVPAGQPHAIGAGILLVELQEPTDFSIMLEHAAFGIEEAQAWLGLDRTQAQSAVVHDALAPAGLSALRRRWDEPGEPVQPVLPTQADGFFRAELLDSRSGDAKTDAGFSVLVTVDGAGRLITTAGHEIPLQQGQTVLTPYSTGDLVVSGDVTVLRCRPGTTTDAPAATPDDRQHTQTTDSEAGQ